MQYTSTRSNTSLGSFSDVLLTGLAPDGGLAMPETIPQISRSILESWKTLSYQDLAYEIMHRYISDIPEADLRRLINQAYTEEKFHSKDITPLTPLGSSGLYLLELSNGPSLAFKDIAMQFLGQAFEYVLEKRGETINILGATSGDTGSAAEYAMIGKHNVNVFMLSPQGRMSAFQQAQMYALDEPNIYNIAVAGVFDDCQDLVKAVNADAAFKTTYKIGAVNSINWARVLAQSVYYFKAYFALGIDIGAPADFTVPSGNFGNIFAGYLAKAMGLPIRRLIAATNENDVLFEFFSTGKYRVRASQDVAKTSSPSMDIGKASNFERYIYLMAHRSAQQTAKWWDDIAAGKIPAIDAHNTWERIRESGLSAGKSTHADRIRTIKQIDAAYGRLIDPHTADGVFTAETRAEAGIPMICLETALPAKFADTVKEAVGREPERPARFAGIEDKPRHCHEIDNNVGILKSYIESKLQA